MVTPGRGWPAASRILPRSSAETPAKRGRVPPNARASWRSRCQDRPSRIHRNARADAVMTLPSEIDLYSHLEPAAEVPLTHQPHVAGTNRIGIPRAIGGDDDG